MFKRIKRSLAVLLSLAIGIGFYAVPAQAADLLKNASATLSNPKAGGSSSYTYTGTVRSAGTIKGIKMAYRTLASGSTQHPTSLSLAGATKGALTGLVAADWAIDKTHVASGIVYLASPTGDAKNQDDVISWVIESVTNPPIVNSSNTGCQQNTTNASAGTCFIKIQTYNTDDITTMNNETPANILDETTIAFSVTAEISVSARVDSTLSFTVVGINQGTTVATAGAASSTTATASFNDLPFGNLTVGTPKVLAQKLYVKTNAVNGYEVKVKSTSTNPLNGVYGANNIDPWDNNNTFDGVSTAPNWTTPQSWTAPTSTTANAYSGYIGVSTSDTDVWAATAKTGANSNKWAPLNNSWNKLMDSDTPDLGGESNHVQITYAIEVNVYQPADSYTGTIQYSCVPSY
jgi:hypothetical protein